MLFGHKYPNVFIVPCQKNKNQTRDSNHQPTPKIKKPKKERSGGPRVGTRGHRLRSLCWRAVEELPITRGWEGGRSLPSPSDGSLWRRAEGWRVGDERGAVTTGPLTQWAEGKFQVPIFKG